MDVYRFLQSRYKFAPGSDVDCFILDRLGKDWVEKWYETVQQYSLQVLVHDDDALTVADVYSAFEENQPVH